MEKKNWINPELLDLAVSETKDEPTTKDFPHVFVCYECKTHYYLPKDVCPKCGSKDVRVEICPTDVVPES